MTEPARIDQETIACMTAWRHDLHAHPELAFEEVRTAALVEKVLRELGLEVATGLGVTGLVATLENGEGPTVGLRADMDALPIDEQSDVAHRSTRAGTMHACGHDGHTAMLLGAARYLTAHRDDFRGTVRFIFQPAEENEGGGRAMVEDGLFERFPCDAVYGLHNWPGLEAGRFAIQPGPMMAALDTFEITVQGHGCHAAMPEQGIDPLVCAANIVSALQGIVARRLAPHETAVVSVTQLHGGDSWNVIPDRALLRGTVRSFDVGVQDRIEQAIREIATGTAAASGATAELAYRRRYPATLNAEAPTDTALRAARAVSHDQPVKTSLVPSMASEDFAFMLNACPGAYIWLGADRPAQGSVALHNPHYDFNDDLLATGAAYWVSLVRTALPGGDPGPG